MQTFQAGHALLARRCAANSLYALLILACSREAVAQQTCGLSFISGPSGQIDEPTIEMGTPIGGPFAILSADLAGTGTRDLILGIGSAPPYKQSLPLRILRQNAAGNGLVDVTRALLGQGALPTMEHPRELVSGDFNRDGKNDVFVASHGYDAPPFAGDLNVLLMSTVNDTYSNQTSQLPILPDFSHSTTTGDINADGYLDIFVGNLPMPRPAYFLLGGANGVFTQSSAGLPDDIIQPSGDTFLASLLVDLDGDGFPELVLGSAGSVAPKKNLVLWNDGTGNFKTRTRLQLPDGIFSGGGNADDIASLDVNEDGRADLAIATTRNGTFQDIGFALQILVNQADGTFVDESFARLGASASRTNGIWWTFIRIADINNDGWDDIYGVGPAKFGVSVPIFWINRGDGTFCAADNTTFFTDFGGMDTMDIDGDGRLDFVRASYNPGSRTLDYGSYLNRTPVTLPSLSVADTSLVEGNGGTSQAVVTINLSQAAIENVVFDIFTDSGTASPGMDYLSNAAIGKTIASGQTSTTFPITILGDTEVEGNETFTVNLANVMHAKLVDEQAQVRIINDDMASLSIGDVTVTEGNVATGTATFVVTLSKPMPGPVRFDIATSNGSAISPTDYVARSQTSRLIDAGRTRANFEVSVIGDGLVEATEFFTVNVTNVIGALLSDGTATGTISDDDTVLPAARQAVKGIRRTGNGKRR